MPVKTDRVEQCALFLSSLLDIEADLFCFPTDEMGGDLQQEAVDSAAEAAGFTPAEIEKAWDILNS